MVMLAWKPASVAAVANTQGESVIVGASPESPYGPRVAIGAGMNAPGGGKGMAFLAHLTAEEAVDYAAQVLAAAATIAEITNGSPTPH